MRKVIRLTESDLHKVIKESVKTIIRETSFQKAGNALKNWHERQDDAENYSPAFKRRLEKEPYAKIEREKNLRQGATNSFNREFGHNITNIPHGSGTQSGNVDIIDKTKPHIEGYTTISQDGTPGFTTDMSQVEKEFVDGQNQVRNTRNYKSHSHFAKPTKKNDWEEKDANVSDDIVDKYNQGRKAVQDIFKH